MTESEKKAAAAKKAAMLAANTANNEEQLPEMETDTPHEEVVQTPNRSILDIVGASFRKASKERGYDAEPVFQRAELYDVEELFNDEGVAITREDSRGREHQVVAVYLKGHKVQRVLADKDKLYEDYQVGDTVQVHYHKVLASQDGKTVRKGDTMYILRSMKKVATTVQPMNEADRITLQMQLAAKYNVAVIIK